MESSLDIYNTLFVEVFNIILKQEQKWIKKGIFSDLSITEMHTLEAVEAMQNRKMREIADRLSVTLSTLTTSVNNLIKKNYIISKRQTKDKRVVNVFVTDKGKQALEKHEEFHDEMTKDLLKGLTGEEKNALAKAVENICEYFKSLDDEEL